jgi:hypothetical protein
MENVTAFECDRGCGLEVLHPADVTVITAVILQRNFGRSGRGRRRRRGGGGGWNLAKGRAVFLEAGKAAEILLRFWSDPTTHVSTGKELVTRLTHLLDALLLRAHIELQKERREMWGNKSEEKGSTKEREREKEREKEKERERERKRERTFWLDESSSLKSVDMAKVPMYFPR